MGAILEIVRHLWPSTWFSAVIREAESAPATVAGLFFLSGSIVLLSLSAIFIYKNDANAGELRFQQVQQLVDDNKETLASVSNELECSKRDRQIGAKAREIDNLNRLLEKADSEAEQRELRTQLMELRREKKLLDTAYERDCL